MAARGILDDTTRQRLIDLHRALGETKARRMLGDLSPEAYARALGGLTQQAATLEVIRSRLAVWKGDGA